MCCKICYQVFKLVPILCTMVHSSGLSVTRKVLFLKMIIHMPTDWSIFSSHKMNLEYCTILDVLIRSLIIF